MSDFDWTQIPTPGIDRIRQERLRQMAMEGYSPDHDDSHDNGELRDAAWSYLDFLRVTHLCGEVIGIPAQWPWETESFKCDPENPVRALVKAGALIAAEIDRLERLAATESDAPDE